MSDAGDPQNDATRKDDDAYVGTDPIYQNHAYDSQKPMTEGTKHEAVAAEWEANQAVKATDLAVDQTPVSALSDGADEVAPAVQVGDDGVVKYNTPALLNGETATRLLGPSEKGTGGSKPLEEQSGSGSASGEAVPLEEANKEALKTAAAEHGLPVSGSKDELIERLEGEGVTEVPSSS